MDWSKIDVSSLRKEKYDSKFLADVYDNSEEMTFIEYLKISNSTDLATNKKAIMIVYNTKQDFLKYAKYFGVMNDFKVKIQVMSSFYFLIK